MPLELTDYKSTLVQVMAWCRQATSHYLSQCWPRFMSPYNVTRPQWVNVWTSKNIKLESMVNYPPSFNYHTKNLILYEYQLHGVRFNLDFHSMPSKFATLAPGSRSVLCDNTISTNPQHSAYSISCSLIYLKDLASCDWRCNWFNRRCVNRKWCFDCILSSSTSPVDRNSS